MATAWDVASAGWAITVLGWFLSPIITLLLPKILACVDFDVSKKLVELEICIIPELQQTIQAVDQERMMQRGGAKKLKSNVAALDKMAAMLRHAREDAEDIFDDAKERIGCGDFLNGLLQTLNRNCLGIACIIRSGSVRLLQWARRSSFCRFLRRASGEAMTISVATSDELGPVTIDIAVSVESVPITTSAAVSHEPTVPNSDFSGRLLSYFCSSFDLIKYCCTSTFNWLHFYRDWCCEVVGVTSYQENAATLEFILTVISRWNLKKRIEKVESTINEVKKSPLLRVKSESTPSDIADQNRSRIRTASYRKVFGREVLRDSIMAMLRQTPPSVGTGPCYSVIGIYGVAGSGKTTFARYTRDHIVGECKEKLFDTIMCVRVSETFNLDDIFREMLKDITRDWHRGISNREDLKEKLKESLSGKRFFLILDDLWVNTKSDPRLEELISPLNVGMKGSKILVTARTKDAVGALCADKPIKMPDLDEDQYLKMFMHYALGGTSVAHEEFIPPGEKIAKRLHRSPIAAVTVAGRLGTNTDICFWENTAKLDTLNDTMDALWWSYQQLNPDIRRCLEYCNVFPRRSMLRRVEIVHMWIAQGFVNTSCAVEDMEDVAEGYIQELVSCSFLQPEGDYFTIHDLLHDLVDKVTGSDCFRIENERSQRGEGWKGEIPRDVRHLLVQSYDAELVIEKILGLKDLRTLIIYFVGRDTLIEEKVIESICKRLSKLRVLAIVGQEYFALKNSKFSVPESINQLKHLRYLAFRTNDSCTVVLPSTLTKLQHIQLLDLGASDKIVFPSTNLFSLRHIIVSRWIEFPNIGKMISLQALPSFLVRNEVGYAVKQLRDLNKLRGTLWIDGLENVKSKEEALEANLTAKDRLTELTLGWGDDDVTRCNQEVEAEVLEGMCPPVGLKMLRIWGYEGSRYPCWMVDKQNGGLVDLQQLEFRGCSQLGPCPEFGALPHLRMLHLFACSWDDLPHNMEHLTSLKELRILCCLNISSLRALPQSLEKFHLEYCNDEFMKNCQTIGHPNWQKIKHIPHKRFVE